MRIRNALVAVVVTASGFPAATVHGQSASYSGLPNGALILDEEAIPGLGASGPTASVLGPTAAQ